MDQLRKEPVLATPSPSPAPSHPVGSDAPIPYDGPTPSVIPGHSAKPSPGTSPDIGAAVLDELGIPHLKKVLVYRRPRSVPTNPSRHSIAQFRAYDCSEPQQIQPVQMSHILNCPLPHEQTADQHLQRSVPANYQILQSSGFRPTWAHKVRLIRSEIPLLCAMNSHHALGIEGLEFSRPERLSFLQLNRILDTWKYSPSDSVNPFQDLKIQENTTYHFSYVATGSVHAENNNDYNCVTLKPLTSRRLNIISDGLSIDMNNLPLNEFHWQFLKPAVSLISLPMRCFPVILAPIPLTLTFALTPLWLLIGYTRQLLVIPFFCARSKGTSTTLRTTMTTRSASSHPQTAP